MRYLGIDFGTKRVGIALSDEAGTMGFPHEVVPNDSWLLKRVREIAAKENVGAVVVGESLDFSGKDNPVAPLARAFAKELTQVTGLPVFFEHEALSTQEARRSIDGSRVNTREALDATAAALILTSYLSRPHDNHR